MEEIEIRLRETLQDQFRLMEYDRKYAYVDWSQVRRILEHLITKIANLIIQLVEEKEELIEELKGPTGN